MTSLPPVDKVIAHTNTYWTWQGGPGRVADVVGTADVTFAAAGAKAWPRQPIAHSAAYDGGTRQADLNVGKQESEGRL